MITTCPVCAASMSLDALMAHEETREYIRKIFSIDARLGRRVIFYLGLFRPAKTKKLTPLRMASLLGDLYPDIQAQKISRNGHEHKATVEAWLWAIEQVLVVRETLILPLKGHGYLYEVLSRYERQAAVIDPVVSLKPEVQSKTFSGMDELGELAGWIPDNL